MIDDKEVPQTIRKWAVKGRGKAKARVGEFNLFQDCRVATRVIIKGSK